jgi:hypothetical protein
MHPTITDSIAKGRIAELHAQADAWRLAPHSNSDRAKRRLGFRYAGPDDLVVLERLAALDEAAPLAQPVLVAELGEAVVAAIGADGSVIADPFVPTTRVVQTLRLLLEDSRRDAPRGLRGRIRAAIA